MNPVPTPSWRILIATAVLLLIANGVGKSIFALTQTLELKPVWTAELKPYGFRKFRRGLVNDNGSFYHVGCTQKSVVVVFDTDLPKRGDTVNRAPIFREWLMLFFNSQTGELLAKRSWASQFTLDMFASRRGNYILHGLGFKDENASRHSKVLLLSDKGEDLRAIELPYMDGSEKNYWTVRSSTTGGTLLLTHSYPDGVRVNQLRDADTFEIRATWSDSGSFNPGPDSFTDDKMLRVIRDSTGNQHRLELAYPGKAWQEVGSVDGRAVLLSDERILAFHRDGLRADLLDTSGRMLRRYEVPFAGRHFSLELAAASADGRRFGAYFLGQPNIFLSGRWYVYVWNVADPHPNAFAHFKWTPVHAPKLAFCPGGGNLVAVDDGKLQLFDLPASNSAPTDGTLR